MNYNAIDIDEEVAFVNRRSRGGPYPMFARRGLVVDKKKEKLWYNKSMTGMIQVETAIQEPTYHKPEIDWDNVETTTIWISAYNVIDFWDRYEQEREHLYGEQLKRLKDEVKERADREAARIEEEERKRRRNLALQKKVETGLSLPAGSVTVQDYTVTINRDVLETRFSERVING